ncbi:hypothetical protein ACWCXB_03805 [Streptomyces sp. NPDC001514]
MRKTRVGVGAALALGALGLSAPIAFGTVAADDSDIRIDPGVASPGSTVTVTIKGCGEDVDYGKGQSDAAGMFHLFGGEDEGELTGEFEIPEGAEPGSDTVTAKCPPATMVTDTYRINENDDEYEDEDKDDRSLSRSKGKDEDKDKDKDKDDHGKSEDDHDKGNHDKSDHDKGDHDEDEDDDDSDRPNGSVDTGGGGMANQDSRLSLGSVLLAGAGTAYAVRSHRRSATHS